MSDIAIKAEGLSKYYKLGVINNGTFFKDVQTWMARKTGKEDPNAKIGSKYDPTAEGFWALKDLNFEIKQGDRVGIIGHNGAGKSTLLKVLSRVTAPTEGDVKIKGRIASLLEVGTGFHPELTGRENIYLNGAILGMKRREVDRKIDEIIAFSEIEKHIDTPVKRYSSGMYVRLAFAVAAHLDSEILIADEVLAVGDAAFQKKALGKMNELSTGQGRTVLFVSHQMNAVKNLCNKGIVLQKGELVLEDSIDKAIAFYSGQWKAQTSTKWINNGEQSHVNCTFESISLVDGNGSDKDSIERTSNDDLYIRFTFISEEVNPMLNIGFKIYNSKNECVLNSWLKDTFNHIADVGRNCLYVRIPKELLNIDAYSIAFSAGIHHISYVIPPDFEKPLLFFSVIGVLGVEFGDDERIGAVIPLLPWTTSIGG